MAIIIDLLIIASIASFTAIGYKQGLVKSAIKLFSFIIALVIAFVLFKPVSNFVIKHTTIDDKIESSIVENVKVDPSGGSSSIVVKENLSNKIIAGTNKTIGEVARAFTEKLVSLCVIILLYIVVRIVLRFISALTDLITNLPIIKQINKLGGIVYGFLKGILIVCVLLGIIYLITPAINTSIFNVIDDTIIAKAIYNNNIFFSLIF